MKGLLAAVMAVVLVVGFASPAVFAATTTTTTSTAQVWDIYYTSGGCTNGYATGAAWTPSYQDGGGFASGGNLYPDSPVISGTTIYIGINVTGGNPNTSYYYEIDGGNSPYPAPQLLLTTDSSGSGHGCLSIDTSGFASSFSCTVPEKIASGSDSSNAFDGHIIDHLLASDFGTNCVGTSTTSTGTFPPPSVPEFPFGGMLAVFAILAPAFAIISMRRRGIRSV